MISAVFKTLDLLLPSVASNIAYKFMSNPRVHKLRQFEEEALSTARHSRVKFKKFEIQSYQWGDENNPTIFLIHGWEGQAGNFGALINILLDKGYHIVAFDGPSHGKSTKKNTSMFEYADFISSMFPKYNPSAIISHSFGSVTAVFALTENPEVMVNQWFLVTTPFNFKDRIRDIKRTLGVTDRTVSRLIKKIESSTNQRIDEMNMQFMASKLSSVRETTIIHSKSDRVIPISDARASQKAIPESTLIELEKMGHYGILWSDELKDIISNKLAPAKKTAIPT